MKIKTSELSGEALNYAVAVAIGFRPIGVPQDINGENSGDVLAPPNIADGTWNFPPRGKISQRFFLKRWSNSWVDGGHLLGFYCDAFHRDPDGTCWATVGMSQCIGSDILEAFLRALVTERSGKEVDVPDELVKVNKNGQ